MRKNDYTKFIIMSVSQDMAIDFGDSHDDFNNRRKFREFLNNNCIDYIETMGKYKDKYEHSFLIFYRNNDNLELLKIEAFNHYNQESILIQDNDGDCYLIYNNSSKVKLGYLKEVSESDILKYDSYTKLRGKYYAIQYLLCLL